jgi:hypothetical protein
MANKAGEYLSRAGYFVLDAVRESSRRHDEVVVNESQDNGIQITTAALYESKVKDDNIIRMLQKFWGITDTDARERLRIEKTINYPCRSVAEYLMSEEAMTQDEADDFIINRGVLDYLREERSAWKLSPKELVSKVESK